MKQKISKEQGELIGIFPYNWIYKRIGYSEINATPAETILFGCSIDERELRKCIEKMRRKGIVIASGYKGYYFPDNEVELEQYINKVTKTAKSMFYTLKGAKQLLHIMKK